MRECARVVAFLTLAALPLSACDSADSALAPLVGTTTVTATVTRIPGAPAAPPAAGADFQTEWTGGPDGTGTFAVGTHSRDGLAPIPEGRYEVTTGPEARDGDWMLCDAALCGPAFQANATVVGHAVAPYSSTMYIGPKSRTLWIDNVILSSRSPVSAASADP